MDHQETFILTLFCDPQRSEELRGRLRHVASNRETTFTSLEELIHLLRRPPNHEPAWWEETPLQGEEK